MTEHVLITHQGGILTAEAFHQLVNVPLEIEWFANIDNPRTRRAYQNNRIDFMRFVGISQPNEFRMGTRSHGIAWRNDLKRIETEHGQAWLSISPGRTIRPRAS